MINLCNRAFFLFLFLNLDLAQPWFLILTRTEPCALIIIFFFLKFFFLNLFFVIEN